MEELYQEWSDRIRAAVAAGQSLELRGGGTKGFYGQVPTGEVLDTRPCRGVVAYEPTELVITVRAGTPLAEVQAALAERGQTLAFEPPSFGQGATIGGCVAAGLSGPRRMAVGALRDFVLGLRLIDGRGAHLRFGGQVMKNVAGYDVSRLMAGSLGTLALITELSLKVLPRPVAESTLVFDLDEAGALDRVNRWGGQPLPLSASFWHDDRLHLRLSGAGAAVAAAREKLGGDVLDPAAADTLWHDVCEQRHAYFGGDAPLWRLAVPTDAPPLGLDGSGAIEWGGALRWLRSDAAADTIRAAASAAGGHATLFRGGDKSVGVFHPLPPAVAGITARVKHALDPDRVFGRGRLYPDL